MAEGAGRWPGDLFEMLRRNREEDEAAEELFVEKKNVDGSLFYLPKRLDKHPHLNFWSAIKMNVGEPKMMEVPNDTTESFVTCLRDVIRPDIDMVVMVFPSIHQHRYSAVKKVCCVEMPIPSHVILSKTIGVDPKKTKSPVEKIALQINCKLGGAPWALKVPLEKCMICGLDVYHPAVGKVTNGSVAAIVASLENYLTSWFSKACIQAPNQSFDDVLGICFISAMKAYQERNGYLPSRIIMYRPDVGHYEEEKKAVFQYVVPLWESAFSRVEENYSPKLTVIIVEERINTKFLAVNRRDLDNPPPGTIVDSQVTRRKFKDFFLVSQNVCRGTVSPTHCIVIHDNSKIQTDYLQRLTYKLCQPYYNWCGTVRVPAPCLYANKLAYLVGHSLKMEPNESIANTLYYL